MVNDLLLKYIRQMRGDGISDEKIQQALLSRGFSESDIVGALWHDSNKAEEQVAKKKDKKKKKHAPLFSMLIILAIFWAIAFLYLRIWNPSWNPMPLPPQQFINILPF